MARGGDTAAVVVTRSSVVRADRAAVWARVVTAEGISDEFGPLLSMRFPARSRGTTLTAVTVADLPVGAPVGRAWILLGGVLPLEFDDLVITGLRAPHYFQERSSLGSCRVWEHRRELEEVPGDPGTTRVTDTLRAVPRALVPARLVRAVVGALFTHRHRRLARWALGRR